MICYNITEMNIKMPNQAKYDADQKMGIKSECKTLGILKKSLGTHIRKSKKEFAVIDFYSNKYKVKAEVKGRRNTQYHYPTTMIGENKIKEAQRLMANGWEVFFFFDFTDKLCYFKITDLQNIRSSLKMGGTWRRGLREWKLYRWIDVRDLIVHTDLPIDYIKTERVKKTKQTNKK